MGRGSMQQVMKLKGVSSYADMQAKIDVSINTVNRSRFYEANT